MIRPGAGKEDPLAAAWSRLLEVHRYQGPPKGFWDALLEALGSLCGADAAVAAGKRPGGADSWTPLASWPAGPAGGASMLVALEGAAEAALREGSWTAESGPAALLAIRLETGAEDQAAVAVFRLPKLTAAQARERAPALSEVADLPSLYRQRMAGLEAAAQRDRFGDILDLMVLVNGATRFQAAAYVLVNELAARRRCGRVSLGWHSGGYVRLKAISLVDSFEKKMDAVRLLEQAMEEALDQDLEILLPAPDGARYIHRDHREYARTQDSPYLCSLPIRVEDKALGVLTLERQGEAFTEAEVKLLRLACDQAARRLLDLWTYDLWLGRLILARFKARAQGWFKDHKHTWAKTSGLGIASALLVLGLVPVTHRPEATAIVKADKVAHVTAPFDGHIEQVSRRVGDAAAAGELLVRLDRGDLLLQQAEREAERDRHAREAEKAQASGELADMLIAEALREQASARLGVVQRRLAQADIPSPFAGFIVEGDLEERIGAPVKQGDLLMKVAQLEGMYVDLEVAEQDVQHVREGQAGEIALAGRPGETFALKVERLEPAAVSKPGGAVFVVRCALAAPPPSWWRPGMTGLAKLEAGRKTILWVLTHRTLDFLRLKLWW